MNEKDLEFLQCNLENSSQKWMLGPETMTNAKKPLEPRSIEDKLEIFLAKRVDFVDACIGTSE